MVSFGEPIDWTRLRKQAAEDTFSSLGSVDPDQNMEVDMYAMNNGGSPSLFSQSAAALAAYGARTQPRQQPQPASFGQKAVTTALDWLEWFSEGPDKPLANRVLGIERGRPPTLREELQDELSRPSTVIPAAWGATAAAVGAPVAGVGALPGALVVGAVGVKAIGTAAARTAARKVLIAAGRTYGKEAGSAVAGTLAGYGAGEVLDEAGVENPYARLATQLGVGITGGVGAYKVLDRVDRAFSWKQAMNESLASQSMYASMPAPAMTAGPEVADLSALGLTPERPRARSGPEYLGKSGALRGYEYEPTTTLYRGDSTATGPFSMNKTKEGSLLGQGLYFTTSPDVASTYQFKGLRGAVYPSVDVEIRSYDFDGNLRQVNPQVGKERALDEYYNQILKLYIHLRDGGPTPYYLDPTLAIHQLERLYSHVPGVKRLSKALVSDGWTTSDRELARILKEEMPLSSLDAYVRSDPGGVKVTYAIVPKSEFGGAVTDIQIPTRLLEGTFNAMGEQVSGALDADTVLPQRARPVLAGILQRRVEWWGAHGGAIDEASLSAIESAVRTDLSSVFTDYTLTGEEQRELRRGLSALGYTGIKYDGGRRMGTAPHTAYVFWDDAAVQRLQKGTPLRTPYPRLGLAENIEFTQVADEVSLSAFEAEKAASKGTENLSAKSPEELRNARVYTSGDGRTGYLLDPEGDFGNLFNNGTPGAGQNAIVHAIENGARTLDAYEGELTALYTQYGWTPIAVVPWDDAHKPLGWDVAIKGRPPIIHMAYTGGDRATIAARAGTFPEYARPTVVSDWGTAHEMAQLTSASHDALQGRGSPAARVGAGMGGESAGVRGQSVGDAAGMAAGVPGFVSSTDAMRQAGLEAPMRTTEQGKAGILDGVRAEVEARGLPRGVVTFTEAFLRNIPDKYVADLMARFSQQAGAQLQGSYTAAGRYPGFPEAAIEIYRKAVLQGGADAERVVAHEIAHHLNTFVSEADQAAIKAAYLAERSRHAPGDAGGSRPYSNKTYRWANEGEWFAEKLVDRSLQATYHTATPELRGALERALEVVKAWMVATAEYMRLTGNTDPMERIYANIRAGKYDVNQRIDPWAPGSGMGVNPQMAGGIPPVPKYPLGSSYSGSSGGVPPSGGPPGGVPPSGAASIPPTSRQAVDLLLKAMRSARALHPLQVQNVDDLHYQQAGAIANAYKTFTGEEAAVQAMGSIKGTLAGPVQYPGLKGVLTQPQVDALYQGVTSHADLRPFDKLHAHIALYNITEGILPTPSTLWQLARVYPDVAKQVIDMTPKPPWWTRAYNLTTDLLGTSRTLQTFGEFSASTRQASMSAARHPRIWAQAMRNQIDATFSEDAAKRIMAEIAADPLSKYLDYAKVDILPIDSSGVPLTLREEAFFSDLAQKVPGVKESGRGHTTTMNSQRAGLFYDILQRRFTPEQLALVDNAKALREPSANTSLSVLAELKKAEDNLKAAGAFVNAITGRGTLKGLEANARLLNALFYSPRNTIGRFQVHLMPLSFWTNPMIAREATENLAAYYATGIGFLEMARRAGRLNVGTDPDESDFGKIVLPNGTRIDIWGGNAQMMRFIARLGGEETTASGFTKPITKLDAITDYLTSKLAPVPGYAASILREKDFAGRPMTARKMAEDAVKLAAPLWLQSMIEATSNAGLSGLAVAAPLGGVGIGIQSYRTGQQLAEGGRYITLQGEKQLDALTSEAWRGVIEKDTALQGYRSYAEWNQKKEQELLPNMLTITRGDEEAARKLAIDRLNNSMPAQKYAASRERLKDKWVMENPNTALRLYNQEATKPWYDRNSKYSLNEFQRDLAKVKSRSTSR